MRGYVVRWERTGKRLRDSSIEERIIKEVLDQYPEDSVAGGQSILKAMVSASFTLRRNLMTPRSSSGRNWMG